MNLTLVHESRILMPATVAPRPDRGVLMRHNQLYDYEGLREEARRIFEESGLTQTQLADKMQRSQSVISRALNEPNSAFAKTLREIIDHLSDYRIEEEVEVNFRAVRKN